MNVASRFMRPPYLAYRRSVAQTDDGFVSSGSGADSGGATGIGRGVSVGAVVGNTSARCRSASTNARQDGKRSVGFFASARATAWRSSAGSDISCGSDCVCCLASCAAVRPGKGKSTHQHLLIDDRQAVLIALGRRLVVEHLGRCIGRRHAGDERILGSRGELLHQSEVGHLDVIARESASFPA